MLKWCETSYSVPLNPPLEALFLKYLHYSSSQPSESSEWRAETEIKIGGTDEKRKSHRSSDIEADIKMKCK